MDTLYPELKDYIYYYCGRFMTEDEAMARKTASHYNLETESETMLTMMKEKGWISDEPKILSMIEDGKEALKERIIRRIWEEHQHELNLNLCPACSKITRTPKAKQCRFCFHDWH
ncbi:hypothetical protein DVR12_20605 [Chitinophaga silvatica]|uniref:Uncharacterized protein n=1 Tax=Chitinophaga silvatica TaxID=2282649 RepID=A0A3E1Y5U7_9BACT|nr:hypothetical protein [Chitinophaga silvatica]RFS20120.1 hypothetical protein DVR12_20605 [Chitinophaga silvatica]